MPYRIPTEDERKALFEGLKRASSLAAWTYLQSLAIRLFHLLAEGSELARARQKLSENPPFDPRLLAMMCDRIDSISLAVYWLRQGIRRCFIEAEDSAHMAGAIRGLLDWQTQCARMRDKYKLSYLPEKLPNWPQVLETQQLFEATAEQLKIVLHRGTWFPPAPPLADPAIIFEMTDPAIRLFTLPDIQRLKTLERAPIDQNPDAPLFIASHQVIPHFGIWEPYRVVTKKILWGLGKTPVQPIDPRNAELAGCMNYLHAGRRAPPLHFIDNNGKAVREIIAWRLIWIDDRYGENPIPPEEEHYGFLPVHRP